MSNAKQVIQMLREESGHQLGQSNMHQHNTVGDLDTTQVESLLIDGKRKEAMAQAEATGHWGVSLLVARSMGEAAWAEAVARLAIQFDQDSPLCNFIQVMALTPQMHGLRVLIVSISHSAMVPGLYSFNFK